MNFRTANQNDIEKVANLHAESWRSAYRGILSDDFLDNHVEKDRLKTWTERLINPAKNQVVLLGEKNLELFGFACAFGSESEEFGTFIDNLHVKPNFKGNGLGKILLKKISDWSLEKFNQPKFYLWVLDDNINAKKFYDLQGGKNIETVVKIEPDGNELKVCRYVWVKN